MDAAKDVKYVSRLFDFLYIDKEIEMRKTHRQNDTQLPYCHGFAKYYSLFFFFSCILNQVKGVQHTHTYFSV